MYLSNVESDRQGTRPSLTADGERHSGRQLPNRSLALRLVAARRLELLVPRGAVLGGSLWKGRSPQSATPAGAEVPRLRRAALGAQPRWMAKKV